MITRLLRSLAFASLLLTSALSEAAGAAGFSSSSAPAIPQTTEKLFIYCGNLPGCTSGFTPFKQYFGNVLWVLGVRLDSYVYVLGALFIMIGGARILLSGGESEGITKGKNTIIWSIVGIFVATFTFDLLGFIKMEVSTRVSGLDLVFSVINTLTGSIFTLLYIALVGVALFSGMRMVLSFGKEDQFKKGQDGLFYAALGAIIIDLAQTIVAAFSTL